LPEFNSSQGRYEGSSFFRDPSIYSRCLGPILF
jgi:hypothetical protein